ncbi:MAG: 1A family penicillin-binding protein [uncultured bacterium]|nr:MAG: 1A family penicillin-binding protein [uncultured bacterium]
MGEKKSKNSKTHHFYFKQIFLGVLDSVVVITLIGVAVFVWLYVSATPPASQLAERKIAQTSTLYDQSGEHVLYEIHGEENRKIIAHDEIPDSLRFATIATEDANFYRHSGVDPFAMMRAFKVNIQNNGVRQGASTITQQLARSAFLTRERTIKRKIMEAIFALKIERHYSKEEILDQYLNEVPYGANAYGVEMASQTYFGKSAKDLTLDESAFLAGLPKAPSYYSPYNTHHKEVVARQKNILQRVGELELASQEEISKALEVDTLAKIKPLTHPILAPHFVFFVLEQLEEKYGKEFLQTGGLEIFTTLNFQMQEIGERVVSEGAVRNIARGASNAGLVAIDPKNGDILTMVGSKDYFNTAIDGQVNIATAQRQPGSSFKPFAYAHAFELGYQPETMILDARTNFGPDGSGRPYIPRNYDGKFHGLLPMRSTLAMSLNVPAVKVLYLASIDGVIDLAHRMGITTLNDRKRYGLSLVLGGGEVKLLDMASAFSVFATEGVRNPAQSIKKIVDRKGKVFEKQELAPERILDVQVARKINSILSDNKARTPIFGPRSPLILEGHTVAAKTGTTSEFRDAWTVGFTPSIAVGVWAGNNNNAPMKAGADGVFVAAPIWNAFMKDVLKNAPNETFTAYDSFNPGNSKIAGGPGVVMKQKITYYNNKTGKIVSESKAKKTDSSKIEKRIEYIPISNGSVSQTKNNTQSVALPNPNDPMYKQWITTNNDTIVGN